MYQRNGKWYSDFMYEGKRYTKGWGSISKSIAKEKERRFKNDVASGKYESKKEKVEFESFVIKYLNEKRLNNKPRGYAYYIDSVKPFVSFFLGKKLIVIKGKDGDTYEFEHIKGGREKIKYLSDIHPFMVQQFKHERKKDKVGVTGREVSGCTVNKSLKVLSNMFRLAKKWKMAKENPAEDIDRFKEKPDDVTVLDVEREREFFKAIERNSRIRYLNGIAHLAIYTGMRLREILDLEKDRVDLKGMVLKLEDTKNGEKREVPLTMNLTKILEEAINRVSKNNPYVFPSPRTGKPYTSIDKAFKAAMKEAGFDHYKFHWLRHSFASRMAEEGLDEKTTMEIGGWKTNSMVKRYTHPSIEHKRRAIEKIQKGVPLILPLAGKSEQPSNLTTTLSSDNIKVI